MWLLIASLVPLVFGPFIVKALQTSPPLARLLDGFIFTSVGAIIFVHILPEALDKSGLFALAALVTGLVLPFIVEKTIYGAEKSNIVIAGLAIIGLFIHGMLDGAALSVSSDTGHGNMLAIAVLFHRLPVGLAIWWMAKPRFGLKVAVIIIFILSISTIASFVITSNFMPDFAAGSFWYIFQSLLVGTLIHVLAHQSMGPTHPVEKGHFQYFSVAGVILGITLVYFLGEISSHYHEHNISNLSNTFKFLIVNSAGPILLGLVLTVATHMLLEVRFLTWIKKKGQFVQFLKVITVGFVMNVCSCEIVGKYRKMLKNKVFHSTAFFFLLTASETGVATIVLSIWLLGFKVGLARFLFVILIGLIFGFIFNKIAQNTPKELFQINEHHHHKSTFKQTVLSRLGHVADHTLPFLLLNLGLASLFGKVLEPGSILSISPVFQIILAALVGIPVPVCSLSSTLLLAVLMHKGLADGAAVAFILSGVLTNATAIKYIVEIYTKKTVVFYTAGVFTLSLFFGYLLEFIMPGVSHAPSGDITALHTGIFDYISPFILGALTLWTILRLGVYGFVSQVLFLFGHRHGEKHLCGHHPTKME